MFRKALYGAVALTALFVGAAQAEDLKEFRIGLIGGENEADRLRNFQCMVDKTLEIAQAVGFVLPADQADAEFLEVGGLGRADGEYGERDGAEKCFPEHDVSPIDAG